LWHHDPFKASIGKYDFKLLDDDCVNKFYEEIKEEVQKELSDRDYGFFLPDYCITRYKNNLKNYPEKILKYLKEFNKIETKKSLMIEVPFVLRNSGNSPAEDLDIWMTFPGDLEVSGEIPESPKEPERPNRPKSVDDCFSMNLGAINNLKANPLINLKELTGPEIEYSDLIKVHYHLKRLKHGLRNGLPLLVIFESKQKIHNFQVEYIINVSNYPKQINGKLFVIVSKNEIT
jgi:hypothetical protein